MQKRKGPEQSNTVGRLRRRLSNVAWVLEEKQKVQCLDSKFQKGERDLICLWLQVIGQISWELRIVNWTYNLKVTGGHGESESAVLTKFGEWVREVWEEKNWRHGAWRILPMENRDMGGNWLGKWSQSVFVS